MQEVIESSLPWNVIWSAVCATCALLMCLGAFFVWVIRVTLRAEFSGVKQNITEMELRITNTFVTKTACKSIREDCRLRHTKL